MQKQWYHQWCGNKEVASRSDRARHYQLFFQCVIYSHTKTTVKPLERVYTPFFIGEENHFGVRFS